MNKNLIKTGIIISMYFLTACRSSPQLEDYPKSKAKLTEPFTAFNLATYKAVVVSCDLGLLRLNVLPYSFPKIEIHKTYQKYVSLEPRNDTLFIFTRNTPRKTEEFSINKTINLFSPGLNFIKTNSTQLVIKDFEEKELQIENLDNSLRMVNCKIQNLSMINKGISNIQLDPSNYFETLLVKSNEKSYFNSTAQILGKFTLIKKTLDNTTFKNTPKNSFQWIKN
jgi:hypothetical protein